MKRFTDALKNRERAKQEENLTNEHKAGGGLHAIMAPWIRAVSERYGVGKSLLCVYVCANPYRYSLSV